MKTSIPLIVFSIIMVIFTGCATPKSQAVADPGPFPSDYEKIIRAQYSDANSIGYPQKSKNPAGWSVSVTTKIEALGTTMTTDRSVIIRDGKIVE